MNKQNGKINVIAMWTKDDIILDFKLGYIRLNF